MLLAAVRRIVLVVAGVAAFCALISSAAGALLGASITRSIAVGFYVVGTFLVLLGFFGAQRGPLRPKGGGEGEPMLAIFGMGVASRGVRTASSEERQDALATAALFLSLGIALVVLGVVVDGRVRLL